MKSSRREFIKNSTLALGFLSFCGFVGRAIAAPMAFKNKPIWNKIVKGCTITCPVCQHTTLEKTMPSESIKRVYHCPKCLTWLKPKAGDHCIYDSYGSVKCPAIQVKTLEDT